MVKEKMRLYQAQMYAQPEQVMIKVSEFEERVRPHQPINYYREC
jgi:hypothetical protein